MAYFPWTKTECAPCATVTLNTCQSPCGAPGFPFPPFPNETFVGYSARPYIDPTGIPVFRYDFTNRFNNCCGNGFIFTSGAQIVNVPAGQLEGQFSFPIALADGAVVTVTYTDCDGFVETIPAYRAYLTDGCKVTPAVLNRLVEHWTIEACNLCPCDCSMPADVEIDFGQGFVKVAQWKRDGGVYPVPAYSFKASGKTIRGTMQFSSTTCLASTELNLQIDPGMPSNTPIQLVFFKNTPQEQMYPFAPLGCNSPDDIVNLCIPCSGGGSVTCPTISGIFPLVITPLQTGCGYVASLDPGVQQCIDDLCAQRLVQIDVPFTIQIADWQPFGGSFRALITHGRGYIGAPIPNWNANLSNGDVFTAQGDAPNDGNSYYILSGAVPPLVVNGISEYINQ